MANLLDLAREHWVKALLPLIGLAAGWAWGKYRERRKWRRRDFLHRLNVSLNLIEPIANPLENGPTQRLRIRTLLEDDAVRVLLNQEAVARVLAAAEKTTEADPLVPLPEADRWLVLNSVLNELSERFSEAFLRQDLGLPTTTAIYLIALTNEKAGDLRTHKLRAMVVRKDRLLALPKQMPQLDNPTHSTRWKTLHALAAAHRKDATSFLEVEIGV